MHRFFRMKIPAATFARSKATKSGLKPRESGLNLDDDFRSIGKAVANTDAAGNQSAREATEAAEKVKDYENKHVLDTDSAENPINKAAKMAHEAKDSVAQKSVKAAKRVSESAKESLSEKGEVISETVENVINKVKDTAKNVKNTILGQSTKEADRETEELKKTGERLKNEEDHFNLK